MTDRAKIIIRVLKIVGYAIPAIAFVVLVLFRFWTISEFLTEVITAESIIVSFVLADLSSRLILNKDDGRFRLTFRRVSREPVILFNGFFVLVLLSGIIVKLVDGFFDISQILAPDNVRLATTLAVIATILFYVDFKLTFRARGASSNTQPKKERKRIGWQRMLAVIVCTIFVCFIPALAFIWLFSWEPVGPTSAALSQNTTVARELTLNDALFSKIDLSSLLMGLLGAAAIILSITFAITQIVLSSISDRYTPKILDWFRKNRTNRAFLTWIPVVAGSATLLFFVNLLSPFYQFITILLILMAFVIALLFFVDDFYMMLQIINPLSFIEVLKRITISAIETLDVDEYSSLIFSLGGIALKSIDRQENEVSKKAIDELAEIAIESLERKRVESER